jgi:hypothetical protein
MLCCRAGGLTCPGVYDGPCPGNACAVEDVRDGTIGLGRGSCNEGTRPTPCCTCASGDNTRLGDADVDLCQGGCGELV